MSKPRTVASAYVLLLLALTCLPALESLEVNSKSRTKRDEGGTSPDCPPSYPQARHDVYFVLRHADMQ
ncbi:hypothetical protein MTO96_008036 [Rhipicephalus appendiculatus]